MTAIAPTNGRVVWYYPGPHDTGLTKHSEQPMTAQIVHVWSNDCVNLAVLDHDGRPHARTSVYLNQLEGASQNTPYCEWMPYQKGQAAKTDALQGALNAQLATQMPAPNASPAAAAPAPQGAPPATPASAPERQATPAQPAPPTFQPAPQTSAGPPENQHAAAPAPQPPQPAPAPQPQAPAPNPNMVEGVVQSPNSNG